MDEKDGGKHTPRVVVIGAGFGGLNCVKKLASAERKDHHRRSQKSPHLSAIAIPGRDGRPFSSRNRRPHPLDLPRKRQC